MGKVGQSADDEYRNSSSEHRGEIYCPWDLSECKEWSKVKSGEQMELVAVEEKGRCLLCLAGST